MSEHSTGALAPAAAWSPVAVEPDGVMVALGDSIAAGIGAPHVSEGCMPVLAEMLAGQFSGLELVNLAVPGETSHSMLRPGGQLDRAEGVIASAVAAGRRVAPITLSIGGNDAMEAASLGEDRSRTELAANLRVIIGRLAAALGSGHPPVSRVLCLQTVYHPFEDPAVLPAPVEPDRLAPRRARRGGFNAVTREVAEAASIRVAEVSAAFRGRVSTLTWVRSGDIHPTAEGHRVIALEYWRIFGLAE